MVLLHRAHPAPKAPRLWVRIAPAPCALVPRDHCLAVPRRRLLPVRRSLAVQGAELDGPWVLRAAVQLPLHDPLFPPPAHGPRWLGAVHARWLGYMGVPAVALYTGRAMRHWASFMARAPGDVVVGERKITSVAEARGGSATLLMASTLLEPPPWTLLCASVGAPVADAALFGESTCVAAALVPSLDKQAWAAHLRKMLLLYLSLQDLLDEGAGGPAD